VVVEAVAVHPRHLEEVVMEEEEEVTVWMAVVYRNEVDIMDSF
jgi:hypothetical protein